jgi:DNA-binding IclR family transcriptional regulator
MAYSYEQLTKMTVAQLRDLAKDIQHEAVHGFSTMHKEKLIHSLCTALGIDAHAHHAVVGVDKSKLKAEIQELKTKRLSAIGAKDYGQLRAIRRRIHHLKRAMRKAMV